MRNIFLFSHRVRTTLGIVGLWLIAVTVHAAELSVLVLDKNDKPIADAVIVVSSSVSSSNIARDSQKLNAQTQIVQLNKEFVPYVTVIPLGTLVNFPNNDSVKHHVYSFSAAKKFDLPLYSGTAAPAVRFDNPGVVVIGCNIHDWMIGYIYVTDASFFAKTDTHGKVKIKDIPAGNYSAHAWHPDAIGSEDNTIQMVELASAANAELIWHLNIKPRVNPRHHAASEMNGY